MILLDYIRNKSSYEVLSANHNVPKGTVRRIVDKWVKVSMKPMDTRHHGEQLQFKF